MQYMSLDPAQREELLTSLAGMSEYLRSQFSNLSPEEVRTPAPDGAFSPVEQVWHLADLEREGFGVRIQRLLSEPDPRLPDFDGTAIAIERDYRSLSLERGLIVFAEARQRNISALRGIDAESWFRSGTQEGVGKVTLCDMRSFMFQHDSAHKTEIEAWRRGANR